MLGKEGLALAFRYLDKTGAGYIRCGGSWVALNSAACYESLLLQGLRVAAGTAFGLGC